MNRPGFTKEACARVALIAQHFEDSLSSDGGVEITQGEDCCFQIAVNNPCTKRRLTIDLDTAGKVVYIVLKDNRELVPLEITKNQIETWAAFLNGLDEG
jgi:hypothetical protein